MAIPTRPAGWPLWSLLLALLLLIGLAVGLIYLGRTWEPVHALLRFLGRTRHEHVAEVAKPASFDAGNNGASRVYLPTPDNGWKTEQARLQKLIDQQQEVTKKMQEELDALRKRKTETRSTTDAKEHKPPVVKRAPGIKIAHDVPAATSGRPTYVLAPGATKIPMQIEMAMNSDVGNSYFTAKVTRPVMDTKTGQHELISQGDTVLSRDEGANITVGNELLPAFAMTLTRRDGSSVDLGHAPVTDAIGMNGLATSVNHHYVRNLLAGLMLGTLKAGRQVIQQEVASQAGLLVAPGAQVTERTLGRAIDARPTVTVDVGELANVVLLKPLSLEEVR